MQNITHAGQLSRKQQDKLIENATKHYQAMEDFEVRCKSGKVIKCHIYMSQWDEGWAAFDVTDPEKHQRITEWSGLCCFDAVAINLFDYAMKN